MDIQFDLFEEQAAIVVSDSEGGIRYHPRCVPVDTAREWFQKLLSEVPWRRLRRRMYERMIDVPRLIANFALDAPERPVCLDAALHAVQRIAFAPYNRVGLNLYRDGQDSVAPHGDRESNLVPGQPIAILSLGATRDMLISAHAGGGSRRISLVPGSLLVMSHASQATHLHGIPKCRAPVGARISLAFRVRRGCD